MAIIDPDGLFRGDRLRLCSDTARLAWPHLFLLANGYGRFEINYDRIATVVFAGFKHPPSEQEVYGWVQEYRDAHLLFLYEARGQLWGQWDCKPGSLPRWKTAHDKRSPVPPEQAFEAWVRSYHSETKPLPKTSEILENLRKSCVNLPSGKGVGVGEGVGVGGGSEIRKETKSTKTTEEIPESAPQNGAGLLPFQPVERHDWKSEAFGRFWKIVWWKTGKDASKSSWNRKIKSLAHAEFVIKAAIEQGPMLLEAAAREERSPIHPATWLNKGRWSDEPQPHVEVQPHRSKRSDELRRVLEAREAQRS